MLRYFAGAVHNGCALRLRFGAESRAARAELSFVVTPSIRTFAPCTSGSATGRTTLRPDRVRALEPLDGCGAEGCTKAILRAHGFATAEIVELVCGGLATATAERVVAGGREHEVDRVRITDAERRVHRQPFWQQH
jgi:hypothetical protein